MPNAQEKTAIRTLLDAEEAVAAEDDFIIPEEEPVPSELCVLVINACISQSKNIFSLGLALGNTPVDHGNCSINFLHAFDIKKIIINITLISLQVGNEQVCSEGCIGGAYIR